MEKTNVNNLLLILGAVLVIVVLSSLITLSISGKAVKNVNVNAASVTQFYTKAQIDSKFKNISNQVLNLTNQLNNTNNVLNNTIQMLMNTTNSTFVGNWTNLGNITARRR